MSYLGQWACYLWASRLRTRRQCLAPDCDKPSRRFFHEACSVECQHLLYEIEARNSNAERAKRILSVEQRANRHFGDE